MNRNARSSDNMKNVTAVPRIQSLILRRVAASSITIAALFGCIAVQSWSRPRTSGSHKYVNRQFGFSLSYDAPYKPTDLNGICKDNEYRRYLLCLQQSTDPDATILVTLVIAEPFQLHPSTGDVWPTRRKIGNRVFYCGLVGSMGVGFADKCSFNLRGKALEFQFSPAQTINSPYKVNPLASEMLRTFRTF